MKKTVALIAGVLVALAMFAAPARAQQGNITKAVNLVNTARGAGTVDTVGTLNTNDRGVICTYNQTAHGGTPSVTIAVQFQDPSSNTWQTLVTSGAITADATPTSVLVYPGAVATAVPTGMVIAGLKLPTNWRVRQVVGGTATPTVTGTLDCELLN